LTLTGNIFTCNDTAASHSFFVVTPYGPGHFINGLSINGNVFRTVNANIDRVDRVDTTHATLDFTRFRNVIMESNSFNGIGQITQSPVTIEHVQNTEADTWVVDTGDYLPFGSRARNLSALTVEGGVRTVTNVVDYSLPYADTERGTGGRMVHLRWPRPLRGRVHATIRCDRST
ncbi:MAG: right-handed parallel beta-helix repeat-containing protein, partial [Pseudorhodobacter sp.]